MKKILVIVISVFVIVSCKNESDKGKFRLTGEIKNITDQKIYLEQLFFSQKDPAALDTSEIKNGKFELSGSGEEEGLFRLRFEKEENVFVFINDASKIDFKADIKDRSLENPVFNTKANSLLKKLLVNINNRSKELMEVSGKIEQLKLAGNNDSLIAVENAKGAGLDKSYKNFILTFIDTISNPVVAIFAAGNVDPSVLTEAVPGLAKRFPKHQGIASLVSQFTQFMSKQQQLQQPASSNLIHIGSIAPEITMNDVNGKSFSLSSLKGKYVLVDFWASWCMPCRRENPNIVEAYNKYKDKNFTVLGVSLDEDKTAWMEAIKEDKLSWLQISDLMGYGSAASQLYGFDGIPYNVLVDPQGKVIATGLRGSNLAAKLEEILK